MRAAVHRTQPGAHGAAHRQRIHAEFAAMLADLADPDSLGYYNMRLHVAVDEELQDVQLDVPTPKGA